MNPQCVFRKLLIDIEMMVFIFSESELLITEWKIMSSNPYLSIFPNKVPSFLKKFLGALSKYLVRLKLLQKLCNSSNQLGSKHHSLSETHLVSSLACTQPITIQCGGKLYNRNVLGLAKLPAVGQRGNQMIATLEPTK